MKTILSVATLLTFSTLTTSVMIEKNIKQLGETIVASNLTEESSEPNNLAETGSGELVTFRANKVYRLLTDSGSGANHDIAIWRADASLHPGYYRVGDVGASTYDEGKPPNVHLVKESGNNLARPVRYDRVWGDWGSGANMDFSFWRPIPPHGYTCIGHVGQVGYGSPSTDLMRCVRNDLVIAVTGRWLWNDGGSGADWDCTLYEVQQGTQGANLNLF